jgi:hypothetical protein
MKRPRPAITRSSARPALHRAQWNAPAGASGAPAVATTAGPRHLSPPEPARRIDRRRNRSSDLGQALHLQLEACRAEAALDAIVVADDLGICVAAASEDAAELEELAAWLPLSERTGLDRFRAPAPAGLAAPNALRRFVVGRSALFMCAVGGQIDTRAACLLRAELGFRRILAAAG